MDNLDFPACRQARLRHRRVEYVNQFFKDKAKDTAVPDRAQEAVRRQRRHERAHHDATAKATSAIPDDAKRTEAVENHYKWVEAAKFLGCHSIRVNAHSDGFVRRADEAGRRRPAPAQRIRRQARHQRDRREPRRAVVERRMAGRRDEDGRPQELRHAARLRQLPRSATTEEYDRYKGVEGADALRQGRQRQEPRVRRRRERGPTPTMSR